MEAVGGGNVIDAKITGNDAVGGARIGDGGCTGVSCAGIVNGGLGNDPAGDGDVGGCARAAAAGERNTVKSSIRQACTGCGDLFTVKIGSKVRRVDGGWGFACAGVVEDDAGCGSVVVAIVGEDETRDAGRGNIRGCR